MKLSENQINRLKEYILDGYIIVSNHPTLDLSIYNYSNKAQWESKWDEITLICRGLVLNSNYEVVAHPLKKFFNYSELVAKGQVPQGDYTIYKKMDGSYINLFNYNGDWIVSSRGSFTSDHAKYARYILAERETPLWQLDKYLNYVFELIHPDTRIVVDYGDRKDLVLLAIINNEGEEINIKYYVDTFTLVEEVEFCSVDIETGDQPIIYDTKHISDWESVKMLVEDDEEGYVIKFASGERMKIKGDEYCRLHKIVTMTSSYDIWETLRDNKPIQDLLERTPDEWQKFVYQTIGEIYSNFLIINQQVSKDLKYAQENWIFSVDVENGNITSTPYKSRKEIAEYINSCKYPKIMFSILDGKNSYNLIWDMCKPLYSKAFSI